MANPFLVLGGIAVGLVTATFGVLQVPGWVASAQDAAAVNDLSNIRDAQMIHRSTAGMFTKDIATLGGKATADAGDLTVTTLALGEGVVSDAELLAAADVNDGMQFALSNGVELNHIDINGAGDAFCVVLQSASGRYFGASENAAILKGSDTPGSAMDAATCAPGTRGEPDPEPEPEPDPVASLTFTLNTQAPSCTAPGLNLGTLAPDAEIRWDDGKTSVATTGANAHVYEKPGVYEVEVWGTVPSFGNMTAKTAACIISLDSWTSEAGTKVANSMFSGAINLEKVATPPTGIEAASAMFSGATKFTGAGLETWDVSKLTTTSWMFYNTQLSADLSDWKMPVVKDMSYMFMNTPFNADISGWKVGQVENFSSMFYGTTNFNANIGGWDLSSATNIESMFALSKAFNRDLSEWRFPKVTSLASMFSYSNFNGNISGWDVSEVKSMFLLFNEGKFNGDLSKWNVAKVENFQGMFQGVNNPFNQPLNSWDVRAATNMQMMFQNNAAFNQPLNNWTVTNVTDFRSTFSMAKSFAQDLSSWKPKSVTVANRANFSNGATKIIKVPTWP